MSETQTKNYCIILAGGIGRRLWPSSSKDMPKQFLDFFGTGRSLLQQTYDRFARFIPADHILVSTYQDYVELVRTQLPQLPEQNVLPEPVQLNTAAAAIWGTWHAVVADPEASVVVTPADQIIRHPDRFEQAVRSGLDYVAGHPCFLAMGVKPTQPNPAFGYIQMGDALDEARSLYRVQSFSEKPEPDYARMFLDSGEFLWNTGLFLWNGNTMGDCLARLAGRQSYPVEMVARQMITLAEEVDYVRSIFNYQVPRQLDLLILEKCDNVAVMEVDFGWADVGCWPELHAVMPQDVDGNAVSGGAGVFFSSTQRSIVRLPSGRKAVIVGLDNYLVTEENGVLMICPNSSPEFVRRIITEAQMEL